MKEKMIKSVFKNIKQSIYKFLCNPSFHLILLLVSFYTYLFYRYGISDHNEQIPIIMRIIDESFLVNDWFINQNINFSPRFFYSLLMGNFSSIFGLPLTFLFIFFISSFITAYAIYLLSNAIFNKKVVSLVVVFVVFFCGKISLGGNWIVGQLLVPSRIAMFLIVLSLYYHLINKSKTSFFLLGLATIIHPLLGCLIVTIIFISNIFSKIQDKTNFIKTTLSLIIYYLPFGFIGLLPVILNSSSMIDHQIFETITYIRHPHHYCPFSFPLSHYLKFFGLLLIFGITLYFNNFPENREVHKKIVIIILLISIYCVIGTIFVEIFPVLFIGKLQLFRLTPIITLFLYIYILHFIYSITHVHTDLLINKLNSNKLIKELRNSQNKQVLSVILIIASLIFNIALIANVSYFPEYKNNEIYMWIENNTENESIFLIPPKIEDFRMGAKRAIVVDWKAFPFNDKSVLEWRERVYEVSNSPNTLNPNSVEKGYNSLNEEKILSLSEKYKFNYILMEKNKNLRFNEIYSDDEFRIYHL